MTRRRAKVDAAAARLVVAITLHFDATRLEVLGRCVLLSLAQFPVAALRVIIVTNAGADQTRQLEAICATPLLPGAYEIRPQTGPANTLASHLAPQTDRSRRILERKQRRHALHLSRGRYKVHVRQLLLLAREPRGALRSSGLLPAFLRFEWSASMGEFVTSDMFWPVYAPAQSHVRPGAKAFISMPNPYNPLFVLDRRACPGLCLDSIVRRGN